MLIYIQYMAYCLIISGMPNKPRESTNQYTNTVKLVYKDHPRDQKNVVFIHRWSLYAGSIA